MDEEYMERINELRQLLSKLDTVAVVVPYESATLVTYDVIVIIVEPDAFYYMCKDYKEQNGKALVVFTKEEVTTVHKIWHFFTVVNNCLVKTTLEIPRMWVKPK